MAIWDGEIRVDENQVDKDAKEIKKDIERTSKLFAPSDKEKKLYFDIPSKNKQSSDVSSFFNNNDNVKNIHQMDNNESSIYNAFSEMNKNSEDSLELEKTRIKERINPFRVLREIQEETDIKKDQLLESTYNASKDAELFNLLRNLFRKRAKGYLLENNDNKKPIGFIGALQNLKNHSFDIIAKLTKNGGNTDEKVDNNALDSLKDVISNAFGYLSYKSAQFIADVDDNEKISNELESKLSSATLNLGSMATISESTYRKKQAENIASKIHYAEVDKLDNTARSILTSINDKGDETKVKALATFDDVMDLYKSMAINWKVLAINEEKHNSAIAYLDLLLAQQK